MCDGQRHAGAVRAATHRQTTRLRLLVGFAGRVPRQGPRRVARARFAVASLAAERCRGGSGPSLHVLSPAAATELHTCAQCMCQPGDGVAGLFRGLATERLPELLST